jgi:hypothetical protein
MYTIDRHDTVEALTGLPVSSGGAPMPLLLADDDGLVLAYRLQPPGEKVAIVEFDGVTAHCFGMPNSDALFGHPLFARGLRGDRVYEVRNSSWIRALERLNRVHPNHHPSMFSHCRHFIFPFHDTTFECIADAIRNVSQTSYVNRASLLEEMRRRLDV